MRLVVVLCLAGCGRVRFEDAHADAASTDGISDAVAAPTAGLQVWLPLDETSDIVLHDASGNGNDGTIGNNSTYAWLATGGKLGGALHFTNGYAQWPSVSPGVCKSDPVYTSSLTVSTWASFESFGDWFGYSLGDVAVIQGETGGSEGAWGIGATNGCGAEHAGFEVTPSGSLRTTICSATVLQPATWYFLTGVYDASVPSLSIYVNGVLDNGSMTPGSAALGSSIAMTIYCPQLAAGANQGNKLTGSLDEIRLYDRALSAIEVAALYRASGG